MGNSFKKGEREAENFNYSQLLTEDKRLKDKIKDLEEENERLKEEKHNLLELCKETFPEIVIPIMWVLQINRLGGTSYLFPRTFHTKEQAVIKGEELNKQFNTYEIFILRMENQTR